MASGFSILCRPAVRPLVPLLLRQRLRRYMMRVRKAAACEGAIVCLTLSDDRELHELNLRYAEEDHATDVLSFSQFPGAPPTMPKGVSILLGDIVISVETAKRQARQKKHSLEAELCHLAVHGFCHLLGYDHATAEEERVMFAYEKQLKGLPA